MEQLANVVAMAMNPIVDFMHMAEDLGSKTHFVKLDALDAMIQPTADSLGMQLTLIKYTLGIFLVYPFAAILYQLPSKNTKHAFSMVIGLLLVQWIFGADWIHTFLSSAVTYLICALMPRKYQHVIAFVWVMGYMTAAHAYRMYVSYMTGVFDFTGMQMVLTMKLTSFAFNLFDGTADAKNVFPEVPHADKRKSKLYTDRRRFAIRKLPNPLEFFGYVYCFTCILAGPAFEFSDYKHAIDGTAFETKTYAAAVKDDEKISTPSDTQKGAASMVKGAKIKYPSNVLPGLLRLLIGVACLVLHLVIAARYRIPSLFDKEFLATHDFTFRIPYTILALLADRLKYYFAWKVAEGCSIMAGFGFEGYDSNGKVIGWKGVENVDILGFELAANMQLLSRAWNKRTQGWLERYTYNRTNRSLVATYFVSAFWHGLYPGFFVFFMTMPLMTNIERLVKEKINPYIVPSFDGYDLKTYPDTIAAKVYWVISWVLTMTFMNYAVQPFSMGSLENSMACLGSYLYIPHGIMLVVYLLLELAPRPKKEKKTV